MKTVLLARELGAGLGHFARPALWAACFDAGCHGHAALRLLDARGLDARGFRAAGERSPSALAEVLPTVRLVASTTVGSAPRTRRCWPARRSCY